MPSSRPCAGSCGCCPSSCPLSSCTVASKEVTCLRHSVDHSLARKAFCQMLLHCSATLLHRTTTPNERACRVLSRVCVCVCVCVYVRMCVCVCAVGRKPKAMVSPRMNHFFPSEDRTRVRFWRGYKHSHPYTQKIRS